MRHRSFILVAVLVAFLLVGAGVVFAYDESRGGTVPEWVTVGGVAVGGMTEDEAETRLRGELLEPLQDPIVVRAGEERFELGPREARIRADIATSVDEAIAAGRDGNLLSRTWRDVTGGATDEDIDPQVDFSDAAVQRLVDRVRVEMSRDPRNADVEFTATNVAVREARTGRTIDARALKRRVQAALVDPDGEREIRARLERVQPDVSTSQVADRYPTILIVDRASFRIRLFKDLELAETYPIALGEAGQETPSGLYDIANKAVNPAWNVPNSDWAGSLAGQVIPGGAANNPLKARWLGVYDGVGIHGTAERGSIGSNASKGCIRMLVEDVTELYDRVPVGAPIYIG